MDRIKVIDKKIYKGKISSGDSVVIKRMKSVNSIYFLSSLKQMCSFIDYLVLKMRFIFYVLLLLSNEVKSYDYFIRVDLDTVGES